MVGTFFALNLLFWIEISLFLLHNYRATSETEAVLYWHNGVFFNKNELLGYKANPNTTMRRKLIAGKEIVWDAIYSFDEFARRVTPVNNVEQRTNPILFFGGSFTFGEGLNDNETIPFCVGKLAPSYRPYNYGLSAYGPQQMLAALEGGEIAQEVKEKEGRVILVYIFVDWHVDRAIGSMSESTAWAAYHPFYIIDSHKALIRKGNFTSNRPVLSSVYKLLSGSNIVKYFQIDFPLWKTESHFTLTSRIIEESHRIFYSQFNSKDFYVVFYPNSRYANRIIPHLTKSGVPYLDYTDLIDVSKEEFAISKHDRHPSPLANRILAARLVHDIPRLFSEEESTE
jgi:hypothetical protein